MKTGFTLIELVMVILLLAILAAIAVPNFIDFRSDAKNGATHKGLGVLRAGITVASAAIALKEDPTLPSPKYPLLEEVKKNVFGSAHPNLNGTAIFDPATGIPRNPWTLPTLPTAEGSQVFACGSEKAQILTTPGQESRGWCYNETTGEIWANSALNRAGKGSTENFY